MELEHIKFDKRDIAEFISTFIATREEPQTVLIKVNGVYVQLDSGKSCWSTIGAAKSALVNHCYHLSRILDNKYNSDNRIFHGKLKIWHKFIDKLQKDGILEFVTIQNDAGRQGAHPGS